TKPMRLPSRRSRRGACDRFTSTAPDGSWNSRLTMDGLLYGGILQPARDDQRLAADVVAVGAAEEVDGAGGFFGRSAAAEGDHLVHGRDARALHADPHLATLHVDGPGLALGERL